MNLFLAFLQPKFDPSLFQDEGLEDGESSLPTKETPQGTTEDGEFRPFIRRLPEFKFWHSATRAIVIGFLCSWFEIFNLPVFWPVLVVYWMILFSLTSKTFLPFQSTSPPPRGLLCNVKRLRRLIILRTNTVRRQIQHMIKYRYVPFSFGKARYGRP